MGTWAMGTRFEFVLRGEREGHLRAAGEEALAEVHSLHGRLSGFEPGSVVSTLNRGAFERPLRVAGDVLGLLVLCKRVWRESGGGFDPTVGPLMRLWGFRHGSGSPHPTPHDAEIAGVMEHVGLGHVEIDEEAGTVRFLRTGMSLDLGAVAKGYALDVAGGVLRERGVEAGLLHAGTSSVLAWASPPGMDGWGVRLAALGGGTSRDLVLRDEALGVSGPHGRVVRGEEGARGHVIDPRSGRPVAAMGAACVCASAALADAWSTALLAGSMRVGANVRCWRAGGRGWEDVEERGRFGRA